jgi:hypothetical protein
MWPLSGLVIGQICRMICCPLSELAMRFSFRSLDIPCAALAVCWSGHRVGWPFPGHAMDWVRYGSAWLLSLLAKFYSGQALVWPCAGVSMGWPDHGLSWPRSGLSMGYSGQLSGLDMCWTGQWLVWPCFCFAMILSGPVAAFVSARLAMCWAVLALG